MSILMIKQKIVARRLTFLAEELGGGAPELVLEPLHALRLVLRHVAAHTGGSRGVPARHAVIAQQRGGGRAGVYTTHEHITISNNQIHVCKSPR